MFYVVATPIGNLADITLRALETLKSVDLILCEDTRQTQKLLNHYEIKAPTLSYHQHSQLGKIDLILEKIEQGKTLALVSDAGTPGISDPGSYLVQKIYERFGENVAIVPIPGASALATILSVAGLPGDDFLFLGFLPHKKGRQTLLKEIVASSRAVVLYESVHRIHKLLTELIAAGVASRQLVVGRELTKKFETIYRGMASEVAAKLSAQQTKGEFVVIIAGE